ncbi:DNA mismatch repair protein Msh6 [Metschnikowia bicuspidata var. bicuspidata NRRL YB-4993]|uniref:DNA mismatch repair protein n=1 Tax=Metschnikowia bicuspidata var. bicuspidata NRRL YB-4993 TaxID=869754 RepID=A0A1A0H270_9ASCO|nr:DNA mismatch repair protein Msh6 [Metschnikowia bicuspidata var. bicuspidata NRRL YB-4993]OBA18022.1 DNA mismatch repair protein Msh6 [Metschnikowia bicuspidata var. bicuspidata NRRL YB-4993]
MRSSPVKPSRPVEKTAKATELPHLETPETTFSASIDATEAEIRKPLKESVGTISLNNETNDSADAVQTAISAATPRTPVSVSKRGRKKNNVSYTESDVSDSEEVSVFRKRRRVVDSEDEDEDEFTPDAEHEDEDEHMSDFVVDESDHSVAEEDAQDSEDEPIAKKKPSKKSASSLSTPVSGSSRPASGGSSLGLKFTAGSNYVASSPANISKSIVKPSSTKKSFEKENEERYHWLVNIKDAEKRPVTDPEYDSRTLFIPLSAWAKFTAFEKQYWEIKSKMWDTVVFFKKGKFYELYENDAMIANTKFDLKIAGGGRANMKLAGVPEMSFEYWAKEFISLGYKVAKVDQKESMLAKEMRGGGSKEEKIIKRELTGVLTGGTLTDMDMIKDDMSTFCMAIKESTSTDGKKVFGVCFVDTATSELNFIELVDDDECTKLDTLITQIRPKEVLCEKHNLCSSAIKVIKYNAHSSHQIWNFLNPYSEFWDYDTTLEKLVESRYYEAVDLDDYTNYPSILLKFKDDHHTAFSAFGALLYYLKSLKLDESIMTLKNMKEYQISKSSASHMLLDGITLNNLEILNNNFDGGEKGTLFKLLNRAITPFGKRMMKQWVLYPLMDVGQINLRYDAVDFLMNNEPELRVALESALNKLPDLERLIARVHSNSLRFKDFLKVVEGFETVSKVFKTMLSYDLLLAGVMSSFVSRFPSDLHAIIASWEDAFDREEALNNIVVPAEGVDDDFDESTGIIKRLESELNDHLRTYKKQFKSHEICYRDSGKELFLIEMPIKIKNVPKDWQQMAATSKVKRYWSPEVKKLVRELMEQKELHKVVCENIRSKLYQRFDVNYKTWVSVLKSVGYLDCLIALTKTSETIGFPSCRPRFTDSEQGSLSFEELRHPCFVGSSEFIPNDIHLGNGNANFGLLTGANAAGKSTLMRTTALAVILSQIGCYLPAREAEITPVDKIMTRLGANDNIIQGKSTFFVELSETKKILSNATQRSLVILDELGRGGSSSDGYAIAEAVLHHLASHVQPLGFFATHYGSLGLSFVNHPKIKALRMGIVVDNSSRNITFLYKLEEGTAPGSFGMNVAAMCGISADIVDRAEIAAKEYEQTSKLKQEHDKQHANQLSLGLQSDFVWLYQRPTELEKDILKYEEQEKQSALTSMFSMIESL